MMAVYVSKRASVSPVFVICFCSEKIFVVQETQKEDVDLVWNIVGDTLAKHRHSQVGIQFLGIQHVVVRAPEVG